MNSGDDIAGPINLGNPNELTMRDLAERIINLSASKSKLTFRALPQDDPTRRRPDIALAQKKLDWQPVEALSMGLMKTIDYFKDCAAVTRELGQLHA
jgi:UDP-glucuronate decarboxylase